MRTNTLLILAILALILLLLLSTQMFYTLPETEQALITQFGKVVGNPVTTAGLHVKLPFVQKVNRLDKVVMEWDSEPEEIPTADKLFISVDTYARWRIADPLLFYQTVRDEVYAQSRLDDILDSETRNAVAKHQLIELVRNDKTRKPVVDPMATSTTVAINWQPIRLGRDTITTEIHNNAREKLKVLGIDLIDIRFKRINYNKSVQEKIFDRMVSERLQIAEKFRSEGAGEAARISGERERELNRIESEAYRQTQEIRGKADADATAIYAKAYNQSPEAADFYQFQKTMETYGTTLDKSTELILSTQGEFFRFLKESGTAAQPGAPPRAQSAPVRPAPSSTAPPVAPAPAPAAEPTTSTMAP